MRCHQPVRGVPSSEPPSASVDATSLAASFAAAFLRGALALVFGASAASSAAVSVTDGVAFALARGLAGAFAFVAGTSSTATGATGASTSTASAFGLARLRRLGRVRRCAALYRRLSGRGQGASGGVTGRGSLRAPPPFFPSTFFATTPAVGRCPTSRLPPRDRAAELGKSPAAALSGPVFNAQKSCEASACIMSHVAPKHRNGAGGNPRKKQLRSQHVRRRRWSGSLSQPIGFSRISLPRSEPQPVVEFAGDVSHPHLHAQRRPSSNAVQQKQGRKPPPQFLRDLSQIQLSPAPPREPQRERVPVK